MVKHCLVMRLIKHVILLVTEAALQMLSFAIHWGPALISLPLCCKEIKSTVGRSVHYLAHQCCSHGSQ